VISKRTTNVKILKVSMACVALSMLSSGFFPQSAAAQIERREMQKVQPAPSGGQGRAEQCQGLSITTPTELPAGKMNAPYSKQIQVSGAKAPVSFIKTSPSLPPGLALSESGLLSGRPTKAGTHRLAVRASDSCSPAQTAERTFRLVIRPDFKPELARAAPKIISLLNVPLGPLKPGSTLHVKGEHFGAKPGKILMTGSFPGKVELTQLNWKSDTDVSGVVPMSLEGQANQTVQIQVQTSDNALSNIETTGFEGGLTYMCVKHSGIISGSDGSRKECAPFTCFVDEMGVPRCFEECTSHTDCASSYSCSTNGICGKLIVE
jgi:hypothetical protein